MAVLSVVVFHAFPGAIWGGFIGVDVFFVISGFLISTIIFENLAQGTFSFTTFYARRIKRIFPALLLVLAASLAFGWFALFSQEYQQLGRHIAAGAGFVANLVLRGEAGYFDNSAETKPMLHLWSLGVEEQFYIVWPLVVWLAWRLRLRLGLITLVMAALSFALCVKGVRSDAVAAFYSPLTRFWELLFGTLLAWLMLEGKKAESPGAGTPWQRLAGFLAGDRRAGHTLSDALSFGGLLLLVVGFWGIRKSFSFPGAWALLPVLGATLIIAAGPQAWVNRTLLSHRLAVWFGLISFPLYLWHWPLLSFARV
ncbi:MAG: acyltransferase, partial [Pseudomonadota bacterium]